MKIDRDLIQACRKNDRRAQMTLYEQCFPALMRTCLRYKNDQDKAVEYLNLGFFKVLKNIDKYPVEAPFIAWARKVVINTIIDEFRKEKRYRKHFIHVEAVELQRDKKVIDYAEAEKKIDADQILLFIEQLPDQRREIFNLFALDGFTHKEIGEKLGIAEGTSKWHVSEARKFLKSAITGQLLKKEKIRNESIG
jgi:RNA polymerase sigma-70 factor (ECF subfamily)